MKNSLRSSLTSPPILLMKTMETMDDGDSVLMPSTPKTLTTTKKRRMMMKSSPSSSLSLPHQQTARCCNGKNYEDYNNNKNQQHYQNGNRNHLFHYPASGRLLSSLPNRIISVTCQHYHSQQYPNHGLFKFKLMNNINNVTSATSSSSIFTKTIFILTFILTFSHLFLILGASAEKARSRSSSSLGELRKNPNNPMIHLNHNQNNHHNRNRDLNIDNDNLPPTPFLSSILSSRNLDIRKRQQQQQQGSGDSFLDLPEGSGSNHHNRNPNNPNEDEEDDEDFEIDGSGAEPTNEKSSTMTPTWTTTSTTTSTTTTTTTTTMKPSTTTELLTTSTTTTTTPAPSHFGSTSEIPKSRNCKTPEDDEDVVEGSGDCSPIEDETFEGSGAMDFSTTKHDPRISYSVPSSTEPSIVEIPITSTIHPLTTTSSSSIEDPSDSEFPDYATPTKYNPPRTQSASPSFFARPGILAAVIGGTVVGLLCAILMVMFIVYRMRKKDEGSYPIEKSTINKTYRASHHHHHNHNNKQYA